MHYETSFYDEPISLSTILDHLVIKPKLTQSVKDMYGIIISLNQALRQIGLGKYYKIMIRDSTITSIILEYENIDKPFYWLVERDTLDISPVPEHYKIKYPKEFMLKTNNFQILIEMMAKNGLFSSGYNMSTVDSGPKQSFNTVITQRTLGYEYINYQRDKKSLESFILSVLNLCNIIYRLVFDKRTALVEDDAIYEYQPRLKDLYPMIIDLTNRKGTFSF
jgi:hypothetical protein